ncbi:hypothetical protein K501DRAFT_243833 [Backusella circina FSU 941]|nr:hypothetical protein K501DRAFT_243833 [Backusella circina FSU 941]
MNSNMHGRGRGGGPQRRSDNTRMNYHQNQSSSTNNNNSTNTNTNRPLMQPFKSPVMSAAQLNSGIRDPFGPPVIGSASEMGSSKPHEEILRKHTQDYTMKNSMKSALGRANAVSYGFYVSKPSVNNNMIIPALPRN